MSVDKLRTPAKTLFAGLFGPKKKQEPTPIVEPVPLSSCQPESQVPVLQAEDVFIPVHRKSDKVHMGDRLRLVNFDDLAQCNLLPKVAVHVPGLGKPVLFSRFMACDPDRAACLMYVPNAQGKYVLRPVYQSTSHGAWQAPSYISRKWYPVLQEMVHNHFGKGAEVRGKTEIALSPELQQFLSRQDEDSNSPMWDGDAVTTQRDVVVWCGVTGNFPDKDFPTDQARHNRPVNLESLYPGSRIDEKPIKQKTLFTRVELPEINVPLRPGKFKLSERARPNFSRPVMTYPLLNGMYGPITAEVFASNDGKLLWTYHIQKNTNRVWVAHAHIRDSKLTETGLPETPLNVGNTVPLAPYEYKDELIGTYGLPYIGDSPYVDIWARITSKLPLVQDYYKAKQIPVPTEKGTELEAS